MTDWVQDPLVMSEAQERVAANRDDALAAMSIWRAMNRAIGTKADSRWYRCGRPAPGVGRRYRPSRGVYSPEHRAVWGCKDPWCPSCGQATTLRHWLLMILQGYADCSGDDPAHLLVLVSIGGRHHRSEPVADKVTRAREFWDWFSSPFAQKRLREAGMVRYVKIFEYALGGMHGLNCGNHLVLTMRREPGVSDAVLAGELGERIQRLWFDWLSWRVELNDPRAEQYSATLAHFMSDNAFDSRLAGVVEVSDYATKLLDGAGLEGLAYETTDLAGAKASTRNVGLRALPTLLGRRRRQLGYATSTALIRNDEVARELVEQFGELVKCGAIRETGNSRPKRHWATSRGWGKAWPDTIPVDELLEQVRRILVELDPARAAKYEQWLADQGAEDGPFDAGFEDVAPPTLVEVAASDEVDPDDPDFFQDVEIDAEHVGDWIEGTDDALARADVDLAACRYLDRYGAWSFVSWVYASVLRSTGENVALYRIQPADGSMPSLLVCAHDAAPPGWSRVPWSEARKRAARCAARRRRPAWLESNASVAVDA